MFHEINRIHVFKKLTFIINNQLPVLPFPVSWSSNRMANLTFEDVENIYSSLKTNGKRNVTITPSAIYACLVDKYNIEINLDQKAEIIKKIKSFIKKKESLRKHLNHDQRQTEWDKLRNDIWIIIPESEQGDISVGNVVGPGACGDSSHSTSGD